MRASIGAWVGVMALACGGTTAKSGGAEATGGSGATSAGGSTSNTVGAGPTRGGSEGPGASSAGTTNVAGATETSAGAGDTAAGASGEGSPPDTFDPVCPPELPARRGGCADGLRCNYGDDLRPWCRPRAACEAGRWQVEEPECQATPVCEDQPGFEKEKPCEPPASPSVCRNADDHLCRCAARGLGTYTWSCGGDLTASACPQKVIGNEGQPCAVGAPDFDIDCYYTLCPGQHDGNMVAVCHDGVWHYKVTCSLE